MLSAANRPSDDSINTSQKTGISRRYFLGLGLGVVAMLTEGCVSPLGLNEHTRPHAERFMQGVLEQRVEDFIANLTDGFKNLRQANAPVTNWEEHTEALGANAQEHKTALIYLQNLNYDLATVVQGIDLITNRVLVNIVGLREELSRTLTEDQRQQIVKDYFQALGEEQRTALKNAYDAMGRVQTQLECYNQYAQGIAALKATVSQFPEATRQAVQELLDNFSANLANMHGRIHAQTFLRASECMYDDEMRNLIRLSDNIQYARSGQSFLKAAEGVYDDSLISRLNTQITNAVQNFKHRPQHFRYRVMQDNRHPIASALAEKYSKGQINIEQFVGALYTLDLRIADAAKVTPEESSSLLDFLLRLVPFVALGDAIIKQVPYLGLPDKIGSPYVEVIRQSAAAYAGFMQWPNYVGDKDKVWGRFAVNMLITAVEAAIVGAGLSGGGRDRSGGSSAQIFGGGVKGGGPAGD